MKKSDVLLILGLAVLSTLFLGAATMQAPVVQGSADEISLVASFDGFSDDSEYRIGVGSTGSKVPGLWLALYNGDDDALAHPVQEFEQGNTKSWWSVDQVSAKGYVFSGKELGSEEVTLKVKVSRTEAEAAKALYVFVAKKYGKDHWYLEDGVEVNEKHW